jgi:macrodomain Ter protein organizer (MatP/YcbG family)
MNQDEKQQLRDHRLNLSFVQRKTIRIRRGRRVDRRSQSKRKKTVKTEFAEKQRDTTATATYIPAIY